MIGAQAVIASLEAEGVDVVFGYPGGQAIKMYDALYDSKMITHYLARHEQGAVHAADGYARSTGRPGVVIVTSGPGATNTVTGIATAYMDSVPLVVITGQVPRPVIGTDAFQEADIVGITMPVVKHSYMIQDPNEIAKTIKIPVFAVGKLQQQAKSFRSAALFTKIRRCAELDYRLKSSTGDPEELLKSLFLQLAGASGA